MKSKWKGIYSVRNPQIIREAEESLKATHNNNRLASSFSSKTVKGLRPDNTRYVTSSDPLRGPVEGIKNRSWVILPEWVGKTVKVHTGNDWKSLTIENKHIGYKIGEFADIKINSVKINNLSGELIENS